MLLCGPRKIFGNNYLEMGRPFSTYGGQGRCIQGFGGKLEGNIPLGRPRHRRDDNIKMQLQEVGCGGRGLDRTGLG